MQTCLRPTRTNPLADRGRAIHSVHTGSQQTIEGLERNRRQDKEVDRRDTVGMVAEKRPPALRRWPKAAAHIPSDRGLGDLEAKLEQLTMNPWCALESVCAAHLANERAQLNRDLRSANTVV